jgi:RNA polymerase sigma factor (sigma-70 family)
MDDATLAAAARSGDTDAWAAIYDKYADKLHDFCWSVLRDQHEAADALHDAFITAAERIDQLRDPSRLRPWLYAICRTTCLQRARRRTRMVPTEDVGAMTPVAFDDVTGGAEGAELRTLVWDAAGGLPADDRAILDLHLRHGLDGAALGEALGTTAHAATVKLGRVRELVERSLGALLVSRTGRRDCPELDGILGDWDGTLTPLIRKRVARHIETCAVCGERKRSMVNPLALLAAVPLVPAPAALRDHVLGDIQRISSTRPPPWHQQGAGRIAAAAILILAVIGVALVSRADEQTKPTVVVTTTTSTTSSTTTSVPQVVTTTPVRTTQRRVATTTTVATTSTTVAPTTTVPPSTTSTRRSPTGGP